MPAETMLMAHVAQCDGEPESEPVIVAVGPKVAVLTLDDGGELVFDRQELLAALEKLGERGQSADRTFEVEGVVTRENGR